VIFGTYRKGNEAMPRVMHISVARYNRDLLKQGEPLEFLVAIHSAVLFGDAASQHRWDLAMAD